MSSSPASAPHLLSNSKQNRPTATATNDKAKDKSEDKDEDEDEDEGGYRDEDNQSM